MQVMEGKIYIHIDIIAASEKVINLTRQSLNIMPAIYVFVQILIAFSQ